ncbi:MAG: carboxypeptidase-like regulatory domain-containing protein, partial [Bacteroidaceae bacterium]|nr:carboxypeptidase-like regulatory domain-containing protein [Bacteroidaceae bacterium]
MKPNLIRLYILLSLLLISLGTQAQIKGVVTDSITHEPLLYVTVQYPGKGVGAITNNDGEFTVEAHRGWTVLRFSSIGYKTKDVTLEPGQRTLNIALAPEATELAEVVVTRRARYSRRNNPAVEFMRKVIAHKKGNKLEDNDYYSYQKYEKMKMSINDVTNEKLEKGIYKRFAFFRDQVEVSPKTGKQILPVSVKETGSRTIYRKSPKSKKTIIEGMNSSGVDEFFSTGDMMGTILTDVFSDINIYDDDIRLLQRQFVSPIGRGAI